MAEIPAWQSGNHGSNSLVARDDLLTVSSDT